MIVRGDKSTIPTVTVEWAREQASKGWRFTAHTHPIVDPSNPGAVMRPSEGDYTILSEFGNQASAIMLSDGARVMFDGGGQW